jgi:hypothetical protein
MNESRVHNTLIYLRNCISLRSRGAKVCFVHDPAQLVNVAINRRAGWPDDPTNSRGNCRPVYRRGIRVYPPKARGDEERHLRQLANMINTPRLIVRVSELGEWRKLLLSRIPNRFYTSEDF